MYIRATGNISPQHSFGHLPFLEQVVNYNANRLACVEPDYKSFIDVKLIRRMSRIIRMGVAAAMECLEEASLQQPDAIVTGTAYGCLEDTGLFLNRMVEFNETLLTPTAFIQSTHNTIGAQIGLMLQCNNYNNAFVHRGFSFESALLDAMLLLQENDAQNVLVGAIDEITNNSHTILSRLGHYRQGAVNTNQLFATAAKGTVAGEGAAFFLLDKAPHETDYAQLKGLHTFYKPASQQVINTQITQFLAHHQTALSDIDLVIMGKNGDAKNDAVYQALLQSIFEHQATISFKQLCGEYPTATAFALWVAANLVKTGKLPAALINTEVLAKPIKNVLIYNHYQHLHHSLLLVSAC